MADDHSAGTAPVYVVVTLRQIITEMVANRTGFNLLLGDNRDKEVRANRGTDWRLRTVCGRAK